MSSIVHVGLWTDHDRGSVLGFVVTLPWRSATLLLVALAILVTFTANRSWKVWRFLLHAVLHYTGSGLAAPFAIWQQQAVLRNSDTAGSGFRALARLAFSAKWSKVQMRDRSTPARI